MFFFSFFFLISLASDSLDLPCASSCVLGVYNEENNWQYKMVEKSSRKKCVIKCNNENGIKWHVQVAHIYNLSFIITHYS